MPTTKCFRSIQGLALRVTRLDSCGLPVTGTTCDFATSESFITLSLSAEVQDSDQFTIKLNNGKICINENGCATLKNFKVEINVCNADPDLFNIVSGVNTVTDFQGSVVGFQIDQDLGSCNRFALEFWTKVVGDTCTDPITGKSQYLYWLLPNIVSGRIGDITVENGPLTWTLTGEAIPSSNWGKGPYLVVPSDTLNSPSKLLTALTDSVALHVQYTTIAPPVETCGCASLTGDYIDLYVDVY